MSERIERGDPVIVVMTQNNIFPFQDAPRFFATYRWGPAGAGDVFIVEVDGHPVEINGNSQEFVGIYPAGVWDAPPEEEGTP